VGTGFEAPIREFMYIVIVVVSIWVFWRLMMVALIRTLSLWFLMIASPLALASYFAPPGLGLKKVGSQWVENFFRFTVFYPAFVLGLVIVSEITGAFKASSTTIIGNGSNGASASQSLILIILQGVISAYSLHFLAKFFEKWFAQATGAALAGLKSAATIGGGVAIGAGGVIGAIGGSKLFSNASRGLGGIATNLGARAETATGPARFALRAGQGLANVGKLGTVVASGGIKLAGGGVKNIGSFAERLPDRIGRVTSKPGRILKQYENEQQARIAQGKAEDQLNTEIFARKNGIGDPDSDPRFQALRGYSKETIKAELAKNPNWAREQVANAGKEAFNKKLGLDNKIRTDVVNRRIQEIIEAGGDNIKDANGNVNFGRLSTKDQDFIGEALKQYKGDSSILSKIAGNQGSLQLVQSAVASGALDSGTTAELRKQAPIFIQDRNDRQNAVSSLNEKDFQLLNGFNFQDDAVQEVAIRRGLSSDELNKRFRNLGYVQTNEEAELKAVKSQLNEQEFARVTTDSTNRISNGFEGRSAVVARLSSALRENPSLSQSEIQGIVGEVKATHFSDQVSIDAIKNNTALSDPQKIAQLADISRHANEYISRNQGASVAEVAAAVTVARNSFTASQANFVSVATLEAGAGAQALEQRDLVSAVANQEAKTFSALNSGSNLANVINTEAPTTLEQAINQHRLEREIGVRGAVGSVINSESRQFNGHDLSDLIIDGKSGILEQHLSALTVAANKDMRGPSGAINAEAYKKAKKEAQGALSNYKGATNLINEAFGAYGINLKNNDGTENSFNLALQQAGEKERENLDRNIRGGMRKGPGGNDLQQGTAEFNREYDISAAKVTERLAANAKKAAKDAEESAKRTGERFVVGDTDAIFRATPTSAQTRINPNL
jgi:hypothetical protein